MALSFPKRSFFQEVDQGSRFLGIRLLPHQSQPIQAASPCRFQGGDQRKETWVEDEGCGNLYLTQSCFSLFFNHSPTAGLRSPSPRPSKSCHLPCVLWPQVLGKGLPSLPRLQGHRFPASASCLQDETAAVLFPFLIALPISCGPYRKRVSSILCPTHNLFSAELCIFAPSFISLSPARLRALRHEGGELFSVPT